MEVCLQEEVVLLEAKKIVSAGLMVLALGISFCTPTQADDDGRKVKTRVAPTYPELAKRMNVTGIVKLSVTVLPNGIVKSAKVIGGHPLLVDPAMDAVKKWKYEPANDERNVVVEFKFDNNNN